MSPETASGIIAFATYFAGALAYCVLFCAVYSRITPHREFDLIVQQHNASAALAFGGALMGYAIALAAAIHNAQTIVDFLVWGLIAFIVQIVAYGLASLVHPGLSNAIEKNALAAAIWSASVAISAGLLSAASMSP
jgi:putative membrane protein